MDAARELLERGLDEIDLAASEAQRGALLQLATLLEEWGARLNLSAHRRREAIVQRLILDAVALSRILPAAENIADLGSGAGIPGIPMAILRPQTRFTLIEARERRHYFQRAAIRALELHNVRAVRGRLEGLATSAHEGVVAQALAQPPHALALMMPWAAPGAWLAIPGAAQPPAIESQQNLNSLEIKRYSAPCGGPERTVWLARCALET